MTKIKILGISLAVVTALSFSGCGSSDSTTPPADDGVQISGSIPTDKIAYIPDTMDKMLAFIGIQPLFADYVGTANKIIVITPDYKIVKKDLNADGTFSIDLNTSSAIFLVNDNTKEVVGSVSIPISKNSNITLDMMPKGKITKDLKLGELTFNANGTAISSTINVESNLGNDSDTKILASMKRPQHN